MTVEIICSSRELFGADRSSLRLAALLRTIGADVRLVVPAHRPERGFSAEAQRRGFVVEESAVAIATSRGVESPGALRPIGRRGAPDVTVLNSSAVLGAARPARVRLLVVREWVKPRSFTHTALALFHVKRTQAVVAVSTDVLDAWRRACRKRVRGSVVPNWLDDHVFQAARAARRTRRSGGILCIGRFNAWKGQDWLGRAYADAFVSDRNRPPLTFLGAQPGTEFAGRASAVADAGRALHWVVLPFDPDPRPALASHNLLVVPSLRPEPFGTVILEGLAFGCRVVTFPGGGPRDLEPLFPNALTVTERSVERLRDELVSWWSAGGPSQSFEEHERSLQTLSNHFTTTAAAARWQRILDTAL